MLVAQSTEFNRGFPESLGLTFPLPTQEVSEPMGPAAPTFEELATPVRAPLSEMDLLSIKALEMHFWPLAGILAFFLLATTLLWLKRKKVRPAHIISKTHTKNLPYKNEMSLMLTLAKQYHKAGYSQNALELLNTVLAHGSEAEGDEAFQLINQIQKDPTSPVNHVV